MRNRKDAVVIGALLVSLALLALILRTRAGEPASDDPRLSTYHSAPGGARALRLVLEELGLPTRQRLEPFVDEPADDAAAIALLAPVEALTPREVSTLLDWVRAGGTLIYVPGRATLLSDSLELLRRSLMPDTVRALQRPTWQGRTATPTADTLATGVIEIPFFRAAFIDTVGPLLRPDVRVQMAVDGAPTVVAFAYDAGRVVAFSDALPLTNLHLRDGDAALLFARAVEEAVAEGRVLEFAEYHQGHRAGGGPWRALRAFLGTPPGYAVLQAALAGLALLLLVGHRFGSPYPAAPARRRSPIEHVDALATAYARAGARQTARRFLLEGLHRRLGRRVDVEPAAGLVALADQIDAIIAERRGPRQTPASSSTTRGRRGRAGAHVE